MCPNLGHVRCVTWKVQMVEHSCFGPNGWAQIVQVPVLGKLG